MRRTHDGRGPVPLTLHRAAVFFVALTAPVLVRCVVEIEKGELAPPGEDGSTDESFEDADDTVPEPTPELSPETQDDADATPGDVELDADSTGPLTCWYDEECPEETACIGGICVRPCTTDEECPGEMVCSDGICIRPCAAICSPGESCCDELCFDMATSIHNCGTCGTMCPSGDVCRGGMCITPDAP